VSQVTHVPIRRCTRHGNATGQPAHAAVPGPGPSRMARRSAAPRRAAPDPTPPLAAPRLRDELLRPPWARRTRGSEPCPCLSARTPRRQSATKTKAKPSPPATAGRAGQRGHHHLLLLLRRSAQLALAAPNSKRRSHHARRAPRARLPPPPPTAASQPAASARARPVHACELTRAHTPPHSLTPSLSSLFFIISSLGARLLASQPATVPRSVTEPGAAAPAPPRSGPGRAAAGARASMAWPSRSGRRRRRSLSAALLLVLLLLLSSPAPGTVPLSLSHTHTTCRLCISAASVRLLCFTRAHMRVFSRALCRDVHVGGEGESRSGGAGSGRVLVGPGGGDGGAAGAGGTRLVAADVPQPVRGVPPVPAGARGHPARPELPARVLPGGLALQVRQQALHALTPPRALSC
jgi:hypothetical protein